MNPLLALRQSVPAFPINVQPSVQQRPFATTHDTAFSEVDQFSLMRSYFDAKFDSMRQQLLRQPREKDKFKYTSAGNRIQGEYNEEILEDVSRARRASEAGLSAKSAEILGKVEKRIEKRVGTRPSTTHRKGK